MYIRSGPLLCIGLDVMLAGVAVGGLELELSTRKENWADLMVWWLHSIRDQSREQSVQCSGVAVAVAVAVQLANILTKKSRAIFPLLAGREEERSGIFLLQFILWLITVVCYGVRQTCSRPGAALLLTNTRNEEFNPGQYYQYLDKREEIPQNIAMHPLKSFEKLQTRNPIRILQVYLTEIWFPSCPCFCDLQSAVRLSQSVCLMFLLYDNSSLRSPAFQPSWTKTQAKEAITVLTLACALTTCLR